MKEILKIIAIVIITGLITTGGLYWVSSPRYEIVQNERAIAIMGDEGFRISPAKVLITNLWNGRDIIIPVTITNGNGATVFHIGNSPPARFDAGYVDARTLSECLFVPNTTNITIESNQSRIVNVKISKKKDGKLTAQEIGISIEQQPDNEGKGGIWVVKSNIFEVLVK